MSSTATPRRNTTGTPKGWSVSAQGGVAPLAKGTAIRCETRLALNADRPTEPDNINWTEH
ncbi:MAG: hypothetical protein GY792_26670 [Gammaproteobacteria bacterium]|nr:hypothetical protein [Gammaproteobacteria bacterium]